MGDPSNLLREHGLQVTAQRLAVLRAVSGPPHGTADGVTEAVRAELGAISRQAVYDALRVLTGRNLVRRVQPAGAPGLCAPRVGDHHHHLICRTCGKTTDVDGIVGHAPCLTACHSDHRIDAAEVIFVGTCSGCLAKTSGSKARPPTNPHPESSTS